MRRTGELTAAAMALAVLTAPVCAQTGGGFGGSYGGGYVGGGFGGSGGVGGVPGSHGSPGIPGSYGSGGIPGSYGSGGIPGSSGSGRGGDIPGSYGNLRGVPGSYENRGDVRGSYGSTLGGESSKRPPIGVRDPDTGGLPSASMTRSPRRSSSLRLPPPYEPHPSQVEGGRIEPLRGRAARAEGLSPAPAVGVDAMGGTNGFRVD